ncbi:MAG: peptidase M14 [Acetobacter sp.]|uniref:peptidase M14 n=1 Tax=Acetobacter sp. TaxID=440 RepID=UPI003F905D9B
MSCAFRRPEAERGSVRVRTLSEVLPPPRQPLPHFDITLPPPDITRWADGNCGIAGVHHFEASQPGPHAVITALMHGNEYAGACVLDTLLSRSLRPIRGRLSLIFLNMQAFARFDPARPTLSRFVEEDMNRLWCPELVRSSHTSLEMERVRAISPIIETADMLLDIHSMLWPAPPVLLSGLTTKSLAHAKALSAFQPGTPWVVQDAGHETGPRLIDHVHFASNRTRATACLLEAGQHWLPNSHLVAYTTACLFLQQAGIITPQPDLAVLPTPKMPRTATVTHCVQAHTAQFAFIKPFCSGDIIPKKGTVLALDGADEIRTPYDNCLLVMPNLRPMRGHTAVRLGRPAEA